MDASPTKPKEKPGLGHPWMVATVWTLRVAVGALFVMSGLVKAIDLWGFVFKIEDYLAVMHLHQPRTLVLMGGLAVSGAEFVFGLLLAFGCYKRVAVWILSALMAVMLPLTAWTALANPVSDCGCFGDFWVISNTWTFIKNLLLTAALVVLWIYNPRLKAGVYEPAIQWLIGAWVSLYIIIVALYSYNIQPMVDFRPFPVGSPLIPLTADDDLDEAGADAAEDTEDYDAENMLFVYERDGQRQEFTIDNLPDDTAWVFVERRQPHPAPGTHSEELAIFNDEGDDVTSEVLGASGRPRQLLLVIPEPRRIDISYTYFLNELKQWADTSDVAMDCLIASDRRGISYWRDVSMASYGVYTAEDTQLKELVRGTMALVQVDSGIVTAKYTLSSIPAPILDSGPSGDDLLERMAPDPGRWFRWLTGIFAAGLLVVYLFQALILTVVDRLVSRRKTPEAPAED